MDDAYDDLKDWNELTNESTKSMIISNSQGVERDFWTGSKANKKQFKSFSQEEGKTIELEFAMESSQNNFDINDTYSEFPEIVMFRAYNYKKWGIMTMCVGKDTSLLYKCSDSQRISWNSRIKYYLNSKIAKLILDHSKPFDIHKNSVLSRSLKLSNWSNLREIDKIKVTKIVWKHFSKNKDATSTEIMNSFKTEFGNNFIVANDINIWNIIAEVKKWYYSKQMQESQEELTMTSEIFGREPLRYYNKILNQPEHALIFYSQFQEYIIGQNVSAINSNFYRKQCNISKLK